MTATRKLDRLLLAEKLRKQYGVISRPQTVACGMSDKALRHRLRAAGPWQRMLPGVYLAGTGSPTTDQREMAALLYAGGSSVITGYSALRRVGLRVPRPDVVDVLVPVKRQRKSAGFVVIRRTARMPEPVYYCGPIRFTAPARAVADAARILDDLRKVRDVVATPVQSGWCRVADLAHELAVGPRQGSARLREVLAEVAGGVRSVAEADLLDLIKHAGLPMPMFNARLFVGKRLVAVADAWWPRQRVAVEVDSREWHLSPEAWEETVRRHARMTAQGILVLHFTPKQIRTERAQVVATIRAALEAARPDGQPAVQAVPAQG